MRKIIILISFLALAINVSAAETVSVHAKSGAGLVAKPAMDVVRMARQAMLLNGFEAIANFYVGSEYCLSCHKGSAAWKETQHAYALIRPMQEWSLKKGKGVLADMDQNKIDDFAQGIDFNRVSSVFDKFKPNAPRLSVKNGIYTISIGKVDMPVVFVRQWRESNGDWLQRFAVRMPVTDTPTGYIAAVSMSGMAYKTGKNAWSLDGIDAYYSGNQPKIVEKMTTKEVKAFAESFDERCVGCHVTGIRNFVKNDKGEVYYQPYIATLYELNDPAYFDYDGDGNYDLVNIGCESCHGPGGLHIIGRGDRTKIVNPATMEPARSMEVCGQCHSRYKSKPGNVYSWPMNDATGTVWNPGLGPIDPYFEDKGQGLWPDRKNGKSTHMQYNILLKSAHYTNSYQKVVCVTCHDAHEANGPGQLVKSIADGKLTIPVKKEDNTLCLSCHATHGPFDKIAKSDVAAYAANRNKIGPIIEAHTHHPYGPERVMGLSRCTTCHMPQSGPPPGGTENLVPSHFFEAIPPQKTLIYQSQGGMPSACAVQCHNEKVNIFGLDLDPEPLVWNKDFDKTMANILMQFYGPNGIWWKLDVAPPK